VKNTNRDDLRGKLVPEKKKKKKKKKTLEGVG
jgi:hypothetical protein